MGLFSYLWSYSPYAPPAVGSAELERRRRWRVESDLKIINDARAVFRLPEVRADGADLPFLGDLFMLRTVPELQRELSELPPQVHAVGACLWEPPCEASVWDVLRAASKEPIVYVQHGRTFGGPGFWPQLVEALDGRPVRLVASIGRMDQAVGTVPANFVAHDHIPQGLVLPHASAVISTGNSSIVLAALVHALPNVLVPIGGETPDNAEKLAEAGCAIRLEAAGLTPGAVREAVEEALASDELARGCRRAQRALARLDGFDHAADLVEQLGATGARVERKGLSHPALRA
jgi:UDP:flavonoid glycosyltransferase YjiC (YdhE family)